jgi:hypothetical protein
MRRKQRRRTVTKNRVHEKVNHRFKQFKIGATVGITAVAAISGGMITAYRQDREIEIARGQIEKIEKVNSFIASSVRRIKLGEKLGKKDDANFAKMAQIFAHYKNCKHVKKVLKDWEKMKADPKQARYFTGSTLKDWIKETRDNYNLLVIGNSIMTLMISFVLVKAALNELEGHMRAKKQKSEARRIKERQKRLEREREEQRKEQRQKTNGGNNQNGNQNNTPPLRPIDSSEIHIERLRGRIELRKKMERAIRQICGRRCSNEVAYSIISVLTDRIGESLIDKPDDLCSILIENKAKLNPALEKYGWTVDEVQEEIHKRG